MIRMIREKNDLLRNSRNANFTKEVSPSEFWTFWGLVFTTRRQGGCVQVRCETDSAGFKVDFSGHMKNFRCQKIKRLKEQFFEEEKMCGTSDWWKISPGVKGFNDGRQMAV